jgi:hypothetical protein
MELVIMSLKDIADKWDKNYRTVKKVSIVVKKLQKNGKSVRVGYVYPKDVLELIRLNDISE